jgi:hypothetical protein
MTATWATVLTAALALAAAGASWAAVLQNRKQIRASLEPRIQVLIEGGRGDAHVGLSFRNTGGGTSRGLSFIATIGETAKAHGSLGVGFLPPDHGAWIIFEYDGRELNDLDVSVVALSFDSDEFAQAWSSLGERKIFRTRVLRRHCGVSLAEAFDHFFPNIDRAGRSEVGFEWHAIRPEEMYRTRSELRERNKLNPPKSE